MDISDHFSKKELTATNTKLYNEPCPSEIANLIELSFEILEPIRALLGCPLKITSGYRSVGVNKVVGGAKNSQHLNGLAADFIPYDCRLTDAYILIKDSDIPYDQLILEPGWIHVSYSKNPRRKAFIV